MNKDKETDDQILPPAMEKKKYFQAGDIVTAERLNELIDAIDSLEKRVKELEQSIK